MHVYKVQVCHMLPEDLQTQFRSACRWCPESSFLCLHAGEALLVQCLHASSSPAYFNPCAKASKSLLCIVRRPCCNHVLVVVVVPVLGNNHPCYCCCSLPLSSLQLSIAQHMIVLLSVFLLLHNFLICHYQHTHSSCSVGFLQLLPKGGI